MLAASRSQRRAAEAKRPQGAAGRGWPPLIRATVAVLALIAAAGPWLAAQLELARAQRVSAACLGDVREAVGCLRQGHYEQARGHLLRWRGPGHGEVIETLIALSHRLQDAPGRSACEEPTPVPQIAALGARLTRASRAWEPTGAGALSALLDRDGSLAARADRLFAMDCWERALEAYQRLPGDSPYRPARRRQIATSRKRVSCEPARMTRDRMASRRYGKLLRQALALLEHEAAREKLRMSPTLPPNGKRAVGLFEAHAATEDAEDLFQRGDGERALRRLSDHDSPRARALAAKIREVLEHQRQAEAKRNTRFHEAWDHWQAIKAIIDDPSNAYYLRALRELGEPPPPFASAPTRPDPVVRAALLADKAARLVNSIKREDKILAALYAAKALQFDKENQIALKMRKDFEREINLKYLLADQRFRDSGDAKTFLAEASHWYRMKLAIRPAGDELLAKMGKRIREAGGRVPERDKLPAAED